MSHPIIQGPRVLPSAMDQTYHMPIHLGCLVLFHEAVLKLNAVLAILIFHLSKEGRH